MNEKRRNEWKERLMLMELEQDGEVGTGQVGVMWSSSQGGCGPLKRLLKEAETTPNLPPASPIQAVLLPGLRSEDTLHSNHLSLLAHHAVTDMSDSTRSRRIPPRGSSSQQAQAPTSSSLIGTRLAPSSRSLSRISRSLNEKAMTQYANSQAERQASQQSLSSQGPANRVSIPRVLVEATPMRPTLSKPFWDPVAQDDPTEPKLPERKGMKRARSPASLHSPPPRHPTSITKSVGKGRIRALLETIDHNGSFSTPSTSGGSPTDDDTVEDNSPTKKRRNTPECVSRRKRALLGMRRLPLLDSTETGASKNPTQFKGLINSFESDPKGKKPTSLSRLDQSPPGGTIGRLSISIDQDNDTAQGKAYRSASPVDDTMLSQRTTLLQSISISDFQMDAAQEGSETQQYHQSMEVGDVSSDGTSYGEIDIDVSAIEEACKMYDA